MQERNDTITIAKALGIILMVIGHTGSIPVLNHFIYVFHMPLFFILSGLCFKDKYYNDKATFFKRKVSGLYVPTLVASLSFILLHNFFCDIHFLDTTPHDGITTFSKYGFSDYGKNIAKALVMCQNEQMFTGSWFLRDLFAGACLSIITPPICRNLSLRKLIMAGIYMALAMIISYLGISSILATMCYATAFILIGMHLRNRFNSNISWLVIVCLCIAIFIGSIIGCSEMGNVQWWFYPIHCIFAIIGFIFIMSISQRINSTVGSVKCVLKYIGDKTFIILVLHMVSFRLISLLIISHYNYPIYRLADYPVIKTDGLWWIAYSIVGVSLPLLARHCYMFAKWKIASYKNNGK